MKKTITAIALVLALTAGVIGVASSATAVPTKKKSCSPCHKKSAKVKIAVTPTSEATDTVTYSIKVTGGKGKVAWAVLNPAAKTNVARKRSSSGSFTLNRGVTYKIWAVKKGTGAKYKTLAVPALVTP